MQTLPIGQQQHMLHGVPKKKINVEHRIAAQNLLQSIIEMGNIRHSLPTQMNTMSQANCAFISATLPNGALLNKLFWFVCLLLLNNGALKYAITFFGFLSFLNI